MNAVMILGFILLAFFILAMNGLIPAAFIGSTTVVVTDACDGTPEQFYLCGCSSLASCSTHTGGKILYTGTATFQVSDLVGMYVISPNMDCDSTTGRIGVGKAVDIAGQTLQFTMAPAGGCAQPPPPPPEPPADWFTQLIAAISAWIHSILAFLGLQASIAGAQGVSLNVPQQFAVSLQSAAPDSDYSDGTMSRHYATAFVSDSLGNIVYNTGQEEVTGAVWSKSFTWTPAKAGQYVAGGVIAETHATYDFTGKAWGAWSAPVIIADDKQAFTVAGIPAPPEPNVNILEQIIQAIINWIKGLFGL